ncbi:MAG: M1 family metallopeptidase [Bacteroidetes bacterium]|nr:M1 family metallopeptidase [Bacteroidota bacterium]
MKKMYAVSLLLLFPVLLHAEYPEPDVVCYRADLTFDIAHQSITATADILLTNTSDVPLQCITLDLVGLTVLYVKIENAPVQYVHDFGALKFFPEEPLCKGDTISVRIVYGGKPQCGDACGPKFGEVTYCLPASKTLDYFCTTTHWLPVHNCIADKATWDLTFDVPEGLTAASAGVLLERTTANGRSRSRWLENVPTAPHCVTWAIADYVCLRDTLLGIPAEYYILARDAAAAEHYFEPMGEILGFFTEHLGPYPVEKIGFCWVPEGNFGGQGMIAFSAGNWALQAGAVEAHELAHHWFGNGVTPATIDDYWLSEGFATFMEWMYRIESYQEGSLDALAAQYVPAYRAQIAAGEGALPLYGFRKYVNDNCPGTISFKGALVLNMLRHVIGDEAFFAGLRKYVKEYMGGAANTTLFRSAMEDVSGRSLVPFFQQWVFKPGWPMYEVRHLCEDPLNPFMLCVRQVQESEEWPLFSVSVDMEVITFTGDTIRVTRDLPAAEHSMLTIDSIPDGKVVDWRFDPDGWLLKEITTGTAVRRPPAAGVLQLEPLYPQPLGGANNRGTLSFSLAAPGVVRAVLHDALGRSIRVLTETHFAAGQHTIAVDAASLPRGCYSVVFRTGNDARSVPILVQ